MHRNIWGSYAGYFVTLLAFSAFAVAQEKQIAAPAKTELAAIIAYARSTDQFTKRNLKQRRLFGNVAGVEDLQDKWRVFKTTRQMEQADGYESVLVWLKDGNAVIAKCSFTSPSGDWYHFVNYYFRADGTLAKIHAQLNTFSAADGGMSVVRDQFYDPKGGLLQRSTRYLDLKSQRPRKRADFMDQPIPVYKFVRSLPFASLLRT